MKFEDQYLQASDGWFQIPMESRSVLIFCQEGYLEGTEKRNEDSAYLVTATDQQWIAKKALESLPAQPVAHSTNYLVVTLDTMPHVKVNPTPRFGLSVTLFIKLEGEILSRIFTTGLGQKNITLTAKEISQLVNKAKQGLLAQLGNS